MNGLGKARIDEVQTVVAEMHGLTRADLKCTSRRWQVSHPRQEAMMLARELTGSSYPQLGRHFGGKNHSTAIYAVRKVRARAGDDPKLAARLQECRARIAVLVAERLGKMQAQHGSSSDWAPPPPMRISKPDRVVLSIDQRAWLALGGRLEAAA